MGCPGNEDPVSPSTQGALTSVVGVVLFEGPRHQHCCEGEEYFRRESSPLSPKKTTAQGQQGWGRGQDSCIKPGSLPTWDSKDVTLSLCYSCLLPLSRPAIGPIPCTSCLCAPSLPALPRACVLGDGGCICVYGYVCL